MSNAKYFTQQKSKTIFSGKKLEIFIPMRYEIHDCLVIEDTIKTIGFFDMVINDTVKSGFMLAAMVEIVPSETEQVTKGNQTFLKLTLYNGDIFLSHMTYVKNSRLAYVLFYEMAHSGHYPDFIQYADTATIYDYISKITGMAFNANHAILEMIASQLARDKDDIATLYRLTPMTKKPNIMGLHSIAQVAMSATGKLGGAYMKQGIQSVIAGEVSNQNSEVEDLLRS